MSEGFNSPDLTKIMEDSFRDYFWPNFLKVVLPFIITLFVFLIIRVIFMQLLKRHRILRQVVDGVIILISLAFIGIVVVPLVSSSITNTKFPDAASQDVYSGYNPFEKPSEVEEWSGYNPFENPHKEE